MLHSAGITHGHGFNKAQREVVFDTKLDHVLDFVIVDALHDDHVDLDRIKSGLFCGHQTVNNLVKVTPGNVLEAISSQGIKADIDAADTG